MTTIFDMESRIKQMIDELQGLCASYGLANQASEERIISNVFLYKFLNDKFMYNLEQFADEIGETVKEVLMNENDELDAFYDTYAGEVAFSYTDTIQALVAYINDKDFADKVNVALKRISDNTRNERFQIETAGGQKNDLFDSITDGVEDARKNNFVQSIFRIITQDKFDFRQITAKGHTFDFYSTIFEYLITKYNVASGVYAEYFTPQAVSRIIAKVLVGMSEKIEAAEIYDPSAGSGSLILHLANALGKEGEINRAIVYTQDISNKSTRFLRLNMMLNGMTESLGNIIQGDTLLRPAHYLVEKDPSSGLKKFSYVTSNPPFKIDFSSTRDEIERQWEETDRFFAGIPKIPNKKKESMAVYLLFIQHILYSLKANGKAAIVVPTGFLTAKSGIELKIRQKMIDEKMLKGVISMPSNIFANTGTNVSILFIDKANTEGKVLLMDASKLGTKIKDGKNQKTVLSHEEEQRIIETFIGHKEDDDFSVSVSYDDIKEKNYSFSAGQYFEVKIEYVDITPEEFEAKMDAYRRSLSEKFQKGHELEQNILEQIKGLRYGTN